MSDYNNRFGGIARLYGEQAFNKLQQSHVCVIGIGGVGSWAAESLARSGLGEITLIDHDDIAERNINRQIHSLSSTIEQSKVETMAERIQQINTASKVNIINDFISTTNCKEYLDRGYDYVIDAIDSIKFKCAIIYYCKRNKIPIITTGGAGGLIDPTMITVSDLSKTWNDPLAASVRLQLRQQYGYTRNTKRSFGIKCVYSTKQHHNAKPDGNVNYTKPGVHGAHLDCAMGFGSVTHITATFGFVAAAKVIETLTSTK